MALVRVLLHDQHVPKRSDFHYNLALEEAILLQHEHETRYVGTIRFWRNPPSVVLGRHQDLEAEVDLEYCQSHGIQVGRRISGGGTVYHDEGNLNMSFFFPKSLLPTARDLTSITTFFTELIIRSLECCGVSRLERESHSNIFYHKKKISGAASYQRKDWILHHATLLLNANLEHLNKSLRARSSNPSNKRRSRYFPTTNLKDLPVQNWKKCLLDEISASLGVECVIGELTDSETHSAMLLARHMYMTRDWIWSRKRRLLEQIREKKEKND